jgi:adenylosuccinate synthase
MIIYADVIVDLQAGDTGKGKVCHHLTQIPNEYTHVIRYNGGGNAGHTIYKDGKKIVTHFIPTGIVNGLKSIIGPGCVLNISKFLKEVEDLEELGVQVKGNIFVDKRAHIITDEHIEEDSKDTEIGTTKTGNGPCYRDKFSRKGLRAIDFDIELDKYLIDIYQELHGETECRILFEGAQGFELDIDWGDYPYVTSSHCTVGSAILNGVPPQSIRKVYGVAKVYRTYVGNKQFEEPSEIFDKIRELGFEYGATTGRKRQIDWLDLDQLLMAVKINGVTDIVINKFDILQMLSVYRYYQDGKLKYFNEDSFQIHLREIIKNTCPTVKNVSFSTSPLGI